MGPRGGSRPGMGEVGCVEPVRDFGVDLREAGVDLVRADVTAPGRVVGTAGGWARVTKEARWAREVVADPAWVRSIA